MNTDERERLADPAHHLMAWRVTADEFRGRLGTGLAALGISRAMPTTWRATGARAAALQGRTGAT